MFGSPEPKRCGGHLSSVSATIPYPRYPKPRATTRVPAPAELLIYINKKIKKFIYIYLYLGPVFSEQPRWSWRIFKKRGHWDAPHSNPATIRLSSLHTSGTVAEYQDTFLRQNHGLLHTLPRQTRWGLLLRLSHHKTNRGLQKTVKSVPSPCLDEESTPKTTHRIHWKSL